MKPPLKGEGNRRQTVEGFLWNLLHSVKDLRSYPSVTCGDSSPTGEPIIHKGEPMHQKEPIKKSPQHSPLNSREM